MPPLLELPEELLLDELPEEFPELLDELLLELVLPDVDELEELEEPEELDELPPEPEPPLKTHSAFAQVKPLQQSVAATQAWPSDLQTLEALLGRRLVARCNRENRGDNRRGEGRPECLHIPRAYHWGESAGKPRGPPSRQLGQS